MMALDPFIFSKANSAYKVFTSGNGTGPGGPPGAQGGGGRGNGFSSSASSSDTGIDYSGMEYLEGLFSSVGAENEANRLYNSAQAALNRRFQSDEAQIQRDWYESLSNSAFQRSMADMEKAGLNPILAYQQGGAASSGTGIPSGSAASSSSSGGDTLSSIASAAADLINAIRGSGKSVFNTFSKVWNIID